jgi:hypothetical protein
VVNRREFVTNGAALAALTAFPLAYGAAPREVSSPAGAPSLVIVDRAVTQAAAFEAEARAAGYATRPFDRDAGAVWMNEIEPRLRVGPVALAGLTTQATLFCLELLARDYGAWVVRREAAADGVRWLLATQPHRRAPLAPVAKAWS